MTITGPESQIYSSFHALNVYVSVKLSSLSSVGDNDDNTMKIIIITMKVQTR